MVTLHLTARVQADGTLELKTPTPLPEGEVEVTLLIQPLNASTAEWPAGYFDCLQDWCAKMGAVSRSLLLRGASISTGGHR